MSGSKVKMTDIRTVSVDTGSGGFLTTAERAQGMGVSDHRIKYPQRGFVKKKVFVPQVETSQVAVLPTQ